MSKVEMTFSPSASGLALASVIDTKRRPEQLLCASAGKMADRPAISMALRVPLQCAAALQVDARALAMAMLVSSLTDAQAMAPATEPPEEPANFVVPSMMPRFLRTESTPTKYIICSSSTEHRECPLSCYKQQLDQPALNRA